MDSRHQQARCCREKITSIKHTEAGTFGIGFFMPTTMLKFGLTGGMGSGKSTVGKIFSVLGIPVLQADDVAKNLMQSDPVLRAQISQVFGPQAYTAEGLNRKWLAEQVFNNPIALEKLNALVHPAAIAAGWAWAEKQKAPYVIKEAALIFESGSGAGLDGIIGVSSPQALRLKRVMARDQISRDQALARMDKQLEESLKMKLCNWVITNNEQESLVAQVLELDKVLRAFPTDNTSVSAGPQNQMG